MNKTIISNINQLKDCCNIVDKILETIIEDISEIEDHPYLDNCSFTIPSNKFQVYDDIYKKKFKKSIKILEDILSDNEHDDLLDYIQELYNEFLRFEELKVGDFNGSEDVDDIQNTIRRIILDIDELLKEED